MIQLQKGNDIQYDTYFSSNETDPVNNELDFLVRMIQPCQIECYDFTISSYYNGLLFHFNVVYLATCSLHHFRALFSLSSVIVHCTIHVFQISQLIVYVTHFSYLGSCTYISRDLSSSIKSS